MDLIQKITEPRILNFESAESTASEIRASSVPANSTIEPESITTADDEVDGTQIATENVRKRRRFADPDAWKTKIRQAKRKAGEAYLDRKGKTHPEHRVEFTDCKCRYRCRDNFSEEQKSLFTEYYNLRDTSRQKEFLCSLVVETAVNRKRKRKEDSSVDKLVSRAYHLPDTEGNHIRVCQIFFLKTFAISKSVVNYALKYKSPHGAYRGRDKRKGRPAPNATPDRQVKAVCTFLAEIPKIPSHYCRKRSSRLYLAPDLNITKLYELYCAKVGDSAVKQHVF